MKVFLPLCIAFIGLLASAPVAAVHKSNTSVQPPAGVEPYPVQQVKPGMRGVGYTVFAGQQIEPFEVEIVGLLKDYLGPGQDIVVAVLHGKKIEFTSVIAGMSGSPVYIDGKLLGAVGYAFSTFAKEPLCGITPIANMEAIPATPLFKTAVVPPAVQLLQHTAGPRKGAKEPDGTGQKMEPIAVPLVVSGISHDIIEHFRPALTKAGFSVVMAGGQSGATKDKRAPTLKPGSPVAAVLTQGDITIGAVGTATDIRNGRVLAFGHRFMGAGEVSVGMASADVVRVVASQQRSFKMANIGPTIGTFSEDRLPGIAGRLGVLPRMVPVTVEVDDGTAPEKITFEVFRHVTATPQIFNMAVAGALARRLGARYGGTITLSAEMRLKDVGTLSYRDVIADEGRPYLPALAGMRAGAYFAALWQHPFGTAPMIDVHIKVTARPKAQIEWLEAVSVDRMRVKAGEQFTATLRIRRLNGPVYTKRVLLRIPRHIEAGTVFIHVGSSLGAEMIERTISPPLTLSTLERYVAYLNRIRQPQYLYVQLIANRPSASIGTTVLHDLPESFIMKALGEGDRDYGVGNKAIIWEERLPQEGMLQGQAFSQITVVP